VSGIDLTQEKHDPWEEPRLTFNYQKVSEMRPGLYIPILADLLKDISDPEIGSYSCFDDLKHAYWCISVHLDDRHQFAFDIDGFPQLQPTRLPQGSRSAAHSFSEMMEVVLGSIPSPNGEPSLISKYMHTDNNRKR
jgi:hypothetical protein